MYEEKNEFNITLAKEFLEKFEGTEEDLITAMEFLQELHNNGSLFETVPESARDFAVGDRVDVSYDVENDESYFGLGTVVYVFDRAASPWPYYVIPDNSNLKPEDVDIKEILASFDPLPDGILVLSKDEMRLAGRKTA